MFDILKTRFEKYEDSIVKSYEARSKERQDGLLALLEKRRESEVKDITSILKELEEGIRAELGKEGQYEQMTFSFFTEDERQEVKRDYAALRARLEQIPKEREAEISAVRRHYSNPRSLTFPAAVLFLVPEDKVWGCN